MTATFEEAVDDILTMFKDAWDTTGFGVIYENVVAAEGSTVPPTSTDPWARVMVRHVTGNQSSLSGGLGTQRYTRTGVLIVQIFVPVGEGLSQALQLGKIVADAYEGKASPLQVWFRNVRVNEVGPDGDWYQVNTIANFTYDEVK